MPTQTPYEIKLENIPENILNDLREDHTDQEILAMTPREMFKGYLEWNGIIGYSDDFWDAVVALHTLETLQKAQETIGDLDWLLREHAKAHRK